MSEIYLPQGFEYWIYLTEFKDEFISPGAFLRCPAKWPYEDYVDFMATDLIDKFSRGFSLVVSSGFKAGRLLVTFPIESRGPELAHGLKSKWLIENWGEWGYIYCPVDRVLIRDRFYPAHTEATRPPVP